MVGNDLAVQVHALALVALTGVADVVVHADDSIIKDAVAGVGVDLRHAAAVAGGALESITMNKASGGDGIPVELFQILKDDAVKSAAFNMPANLENSAVATGLEKVSFRSKPKERQCQRMLKLLHSCTHLTR